MNRKQEIALSALHRIANLALPLNDLVMTARAALDEINAVKEYRITARTWYGKNGGEFRAELCDVESGDKLIGVSGSTWGSDAWSYAMRDAMHAQRPDLFPDHSKGHPTIYFRDVCNVEYEHTEVHRKRDL
jgi:hypothetical protein